MDIHIDTEPQVCWFEVECLYRSIARIEQRLTLLRAEEHKRLRWFIAGIRQELTGVIEAEYFFDTPDNLFLTHRQREMLDIISLKGKNILDLMQQFYEQTITAFPGDIPVEEELFLLRTQLGVLEQRLSEGEFGSPPLYNQRTAHHQPINGRMTQSYEQTFHQWVQTLEQWGIETVAHNQRVTTLTLKLADAYGVSESERELIRRGALLHDIGMMSVPTVLLLKRGPLTSEEINVVQHHPIYACHILAPIACLQTASDIPIYHHERWDGSGYPYGLVGETIPLAARLFAVADVYDVLCTNRPYRPAWTHEQARAHIAHHAGKLFDPDVVEIFGVT